MYTEDYEKKDFPYRNFFLKLIVIIVAALLLVWFITSIVNSKDEVEMDGVVNETFYNNLDKMKSVALTYYTEDKLPVKIEKSTKVTLEELIQKKLIKPIKNQDKKLCNQKKSFIKITKKTDEYLLKVNLVCGEEEDYILSHLNHYSYCKNTYLCEMEASKEEEKQTEVQNNDDCDETSSNRSYSSKTSNTSTKKVKKSTSKKKVNKISDKGSITIVDTTNNDYLYEYAKTTNAQFSNWSLWNSWERVSCSTNAITCQTSDISCLKELKRYDRKERIGTYFKEYNDTKVALAHTSDTTKNVCSSYNYVEIDGSIYRISNGALSNYLNVNSWVYLGRQSYDAPPTDTYNYRYVLVDADYSNCNNTCAVNPKYYYDKYVYSASITKVSNYDYCNSNSNQTIPVYTSQEDNVHFERYENLYGTVCYKSERTRTLISKGSTSKKWSSYNNKKLLNSGYYYTGRKKKNK